MVIVFKMFDKVFRIVPGVALYIGVFGIYPDQVHDDARSADRCGSSKGRPYIFPDVVPRPAPIRFEVLEENVATCLFYSVQR